MEEVSLCYKVKNLSEKKKQKQADDNVQQARVNDNTQTQPGSQKQKRGKKTGSDQGKKTRILQKLISQLYWEKSLDHLRAGLSQAWNGSHVGQSYALYRMIDE